MRVLDVPQGSTEWLRARLGVATASRAADALSVLKSGAPAKARTDYAIELAFERVARQPLDKAVTVAMSRGSELEPEARATYEARTGILVDQMGFALHDTLQAGASPDGLIGTDGLIEIKCPFAQDRIARMWATNDVSDYAAQVEWQMWILGRSWCDVVIYDPRLSHAGLDMLVVRHHMTETAAQELDAKVPDFLALVGDIEVTLRNRGKN
jgi:exodeoxyribonuclease (lambda-induced)